MEADTDLVTAAAAAARSARRAAVLALVALFIAAVVLAIDHGIKRSIIDEAGRARQILDEFKLAALGALNDGQAGPVPADRRTAGDRGDAVVYAARPPQAADHHESDPVRAAGGGPRGPLPGASGDE